MPEIDLDRERLLRHIAEKQGPKKRKEYEENPANLEKLRENIERDLNTINPANPQKLNETLLGLVNKHTSPQATIQTGGIQAVVQTVSPSIDAQGYQQSQNPNQGSETLFVNTIQSFNSPFTLKLVPGSQLRNEEEEKKKKLEEQYSSPRPDDKLRHPFK